ncbi:TPA: retron St85 family effector protein, partial [Enterobacter cloacae]|nr:retron St85 family effector protein [Enterobacter cloacae]
HHKEFITFRAELAWEVISNLGTHRNVNALSLEEWLADFSDVVIILVESYGTVAELGAFSLSPVLRKKLLPILDKKFESHKSFINTGPVTWVNSESKFGPTIYTEFETILTCVPKINERLNRKIQSSIADSNLIGDYKYSPKIFLFFVLVVVSSLGPITIPEIINITGRLINYKNNKNISFVVSIGVALGIFKESKFEGVTHYSCVDYVKLFNHETMKGLIESIQRSRARSLSDLIMISKFKAELERIM